MNQDGEATRYLVVRNQEEQYSIWREDMDVPDGWVIVGDAASKQACLDRIEQLWVDMRPKSLRGTSDA